MRKRPGLGGFKDIDTNDILLLYQSGLTLKEVADKFDISQGTVSARMKKIGFKKYTKHHVCETIFSEFTPDSCYWAGFLAADGWVDDKGVWAELSSVDERHLEKLCDFAGRDKKIWRRMKELHGKLHPMSSISLLSKQIVSDLMGKFNIVRAKSLTIQPPLNIPKELRKCFIRGYFDGDGHLGWHKWNNRPRLFICSGSRDMVAWIYSAIKEEVSDIGNPSVLKTKDQNKYYFEFAGKDVLLVLDWLYLDSKPETRLDRKYDLHFDYDEKMRGVEKEMQNYRLSTKRYGQPLDEKIQREIIELARLGLSETDIRSKLNINVRTVTKYIKLHEASLNT
jgi:DNA-binding CsgD family transcriptional regulator